MYLIYLTNDFLHFFSGHYSWNLTQYLHVVYTKNSSACVRVLANIYMHVPLASRPSDFDGSAFFTGLLFSSGKFWFSSEYQKVGSLTKLEDGIPSVLAPGSFLLQSTEVWKDHLVAHFHGSPPSPARIFSDLNHIWGNNGRIAIRKYSAHSCLIFIPSVATRKWMLGVGFWNSGNCVFTVTKWSASTGLAPMKLDYAPFWVVLRNVPL